MTWCLACVSCKIAARCSDKHHQTSFPSKNILSISIKHEISVVVHFNVSLQTNEKPTSDRLTANHWTVGITCNLQIYTAVSNLSRMRKLTVIHPIVTCNLLHIHQDFPLFVIIFLTSSTTASHGSKTSSARCDWIRIKLNKGRFIERAPGGDTAATQTPVSPWRRSNCGRW